MPQEEITQKRPSNYSKWHRTQLPQWCYMTDGDWFEQRMKGGKLITVAYVEAIQMPGGRPLMGAPSQYPLWPSKASLCLDIERGMRIPAYVVWHNPQCTWFTVLRPSRESKPQTMSGSTYKRFIQELGSMEVDHD